MPTLHQLHLHRWIFEVLQWSSNDHWTRLHRLDTILLDFKNPKTVLLSVIYASCFYWSKGSSYFRNLFEPIIFWPLLLPKKRDHSLHGFLWFPEWLFNRTLIVTSDITCYIYVLRRLFMHFTFKKIKVSRLFSVIIGQNPNHPKRQTSCTEYYHFSIIRFFAVFKHGNVNLQCLEMDLSLGVIWE